MMVESPIGCRLKSRTLRHIGFEDVSFPLEMGNKQMNMINGTENF